MLSTAGTIARWCTTSLVEFVQYITELPQTIQNVGAVLLSNYTFAKSVYNFDATRSIPSQWWSTVHTTKSGMLPY